MSTTDATTFATPGASTSLPSYTASPPPPSYSPDPAWGEQRIDQGARSLARARSNPTGTYTKTSGSVAVVFYGQEPDAQTPSYGRHAAVSGTIEFNKRDSISEIRLKVDGQISLTVSEGGSKTMKTVDESKILWTYDPSRNQPCPSSIPFSFTLPSNFQNGDRTYPIPPSYDAAFPGVPGLYVTCAYTVTITVVKARQRLSGLWTKSKSIPIRINYHPRTRPHRPIISLPGFFGSVKTSPEEWHQCMSLMKIRPGAHIQPISCHLLVPSVQIFALSDTIPFHVQLTGPISSLREFLPSTDSATSSADSTFSAKSKKKAAKPVISVSLLRQVSAEVRGQKAWRNVNLGEGKLWPVPPAVPSSSSSLALHSPDESLDWEGELRCTKEDVSIGGYNAGTFAVKDFILLSLVPPNPATSPLLAYQDAVAIRFVTDPWVETTNPRDFY